MYANGSLWTRQKKLAAPPFGKTTLFQPEQFHEFAQPFRHPVRERLVALEQRLQTAPPPVHVQLEPEIKAVMLEMLTNNFFGAEPTYHRIRRQYVPSLEHVIDHIVRDTAINKLVLPIW